MSYEPYTCIDCGSEFCPCHLAESGNCILCSHLDGKDFCDCCNWNGVCIYQEFVTNNFKSKPGRKYYDCKVVDKQLLFNKILILNIKVTDKLASELVNPGSFVFIRRKEDESTFDTPICVMKNNSNEQIITLAIELKGVKTKALAKIEKNDNILIKGPFWNGILGLKHITNCKNKNCLLIIRGIGQAPAVPVLETLKKNNNRIIVLIDKAPFDEIFIDKELLKYADRVEESKTLVLGGLLNGTFKNNLEKILTEEKINLVHCDGADILNYQVMKIVDAHNPNIEFSCSNNEKMCCGEGVCGCCTLINNDEKLRRLCKMQTDPKYIFEGRRHI